MKWPLDHIAMPPVTTLANTFLKPRRRWLIGLALALLCAGLIAAWMVKRNAQREFDAARSRLEKQSLVAFEREARPALPGGEIKLIQSSRSARSLARFNDSIFAATDGGLVEFAEDGKLKRRYTALDGLPESDLTALATFHSKLFIGSRSEGLVVFDGKRFERYRWTDRNAQAVAALLEDRGRLLIGTFAGGLLEFDGQRLREIKVEADQKRLAGINCLVAAGQRLFVATFADGLWVNEADRWAHFTIADGLPSNRIVGVATVGDQLVVASDFGVAAAPINQILGSANSSSPTRFQTIAILPELASLANSGGDVLLCKDNGEMFQLASGRSSNQIQIAPVSWNRPRSLSSCQLIAFAQNNQPMGQTLWLTSNEGIWRIGWQGERLSGRLNFSAFGRTDGPVDVLTSNVISALAFDDLGRLWAGSFRNGIDVISPEHGRVAHLESEFTREINALVWDEEAKRMIAATAQGLIRFDGSFASQRVSAADGLLSNSVLGVALVQNKSKAGGANLALATSRGLSLGEARSWRGLTTVQGLPSNSVYSVLAHREFIYAGTLSGLAQIAGGRVVRVFKDSNSKLAQNWVAAICSVGGRLFIGTYGGGVFELTAAGEFTSFAAEIGRQTVNPNAMTSDGQRLYVGTLDGAWVLDLRSQEWRRLKRELPSRVVLSVTSDGERVYFGTTSGIARIEAAYLPSRAGKT
jgi:ligand-binding sensor domain-containing protein